MRCVFAMQLLHAFIAVLESKLNLNFSKEHQTVLCVLRRLQMHFQTVVYMLYISKLQISKARLYTN